MALKWIIHPTNRRVRLLVGFLLAGLFCLHCTPTDATRGSHLIVAVSGKPVGENAPDIMSKVVKLAKTDHIALLEFCLTNCKARYADYECTLVKQERIKGVLKPEQVISVRFMNRPFSVAMAWSDETAPMGDRVLYIEGKYNNQMLVRPTNKFFRALVGTARRDPNGKDVRNNTLRPVNMFGFERGMESLLKVYRKAKENGDLTEDFGGYADVAGRRTIVLVRHLPPKDDYPAAKTLIYIDLEYLVPVGIEGFGWAEEKELLCSYVYKDLKLNVDLTEDDFLPKANGMAPPK